MTGGAMRKFSVIVLAVASASGVGCAMPTSEAEARQDGTIVALARDLADGRAISAAQLDALEARIIALKQRGASVAQEAGAPGDWIVRESTLGSCDSLGPQYGMGSVSAHALRPLSLARTVRQLAHALQLSRVCKRYPDRLNPPAIAGRANHNSGTLSGARAARSAPACSSHRGHNYYQPRVCRRTCPRQRASRALNYATAREWIQVSVERQFPSISVAVQQEFAVRPEDAKFTVKDRVIRLHCGPQFTISVEFIDRSCDDRNG